MKSLPSLELLLAPLLSSLVGLLAGTARAAAEHPNIVLFLVDDLGWQDTSVPFYTERTPFNKHFRTPYMERLAAQGIRFTNAYAAAICSPTRTSIMTGRNPARHRVTNWTLYTDRPFVERVGA